MKPRGYFVTDVGQKREHNEDSYLCNDQIRLYAVADGMGGHQGGERASRLAVEVIEREMAIHSNRFGAIIAEAEVKNALRESTRLASRTIFEMAQTNPQFAGMGTTFTGIWFHDQKLTLCHVGDSRAYLLRDGSTHQLTEDHSWIQEQVRAGLVSPEDAVVSRFRNIITRSVGFESTVEPDLCTLGVEMGDCYLLCSDGLSNYVTLDEISQILTTKLYADAGRALVDIANERGGDDNITCVIVYVANVPV
jgi:protein phosphatase